MKSYNSQTAEILINDLRERTNDKLRTATMSLVYELAIARDTFNYQSVLKRVQYAGDMQGKGHLASAAVVLKDLGMIKRGTTGNIELTPKFDTRFIQIMADFASREDVNYAPSHTPHVWTTPEQGLKRIVNGVRPEMRKHMTIDKMPAVYAALNKMQAVGFKANPVLQEISDLRTWMANENMVADGNSILTEYNEYRRISAMTQPLYFTQTLDWRSRMYYRGLLNPSNLGEFGKAAFMFAEQKPVYRNGLKALAIHYASLCGKGKLSYAARVKWAMTDGIALADRMQGKSVQRIQYLTGEKKVFMLYVAAQEFTRCYALLQAGKPCLSGFITRQDGKCNGIQHGAALSKCQTTAANVSITPQDEMGQPTDIYLELRSHLLANCTNVEAYRLHMDRDFCKPPVMVRGYGAGKEAIRRDLIKLLEERDTDTIAIRIELEGDEDGESVLLNEIMSTLDLVVGGMAEVTDALRAAVKPIAERAGNVYWITADGFPVEQVGKILDDVCYDTLHLEVPTLDYNDELNNKRWSLRNEVPEIINYEKSASATIKGIAPNFVHSIDGTHIRLVVNNVDASIIHTHDDIGTHPEDFFPVNKVIREQFVILHTEHDHFGSLEKYSKVDVNRPSGDYDVRDALQATYLFS